MSGDAHIVPLHGEFESNPDVTILDSNKAGAPPSCEIKSTLSPDDLVRRFREAANAHATRTSDEVDRHHERLQKTIQDLGPRITTGFESDSANPHSASIGVHDVRDKAELGEPLASTKRLGTRPLWRGPTGAGPRPHLERQPRFYRCTVSDVIDNLTRTWESDSRAKGDLELLGLAYAPDHLSIAQAWSADGESDVLARCAGQRVGMSHVRSIETFVESFRGMDGRYGAALTRLTAIEHLHRTISPLLQGTYSARVGRNLLNAVADCTQLVGWMAYDLGAHGLAQRYYIQALRLTHATGNQLLGTYIITRMSRQAIHLGEAKLAVELGAAGRERVAGYSTPTVMALLCSVEARGHGLLGDAKACARALAHAEDFLNSAIPDNEPNWIRYFDEAQLTDEFAHCYRDLGKPEEALRFAQQSLQLRSDSYPRSQSFCRTVLATAYLQMGEIEEACRIGSQVSRAIVQLHSRRGWDYLRDLWRRISPHRSIPVVRELEALIQSLL